MRLLPVLLLLAACGGSTPAPKDTDAAAKIVAPPPGPTAEQAALFKPLPANMYVDGVQPADAKITLGRMLYYENRLSKAQEISCNSCHMLDAYGVDNKPTSPGHKGQLGNRNSPTSYNAALHIAQFWDGRAATVEDQAKGPILNPVEMAMPEAPVVIAVLKSIPGYVDAFKAAYPDDADPITYDHVADAIGAFERGLVTPSRFDKFLAGDGAALSDAEKAGLDTFISTGCTTCHMGVGVGGGMYQKLGLVKEYETADEGRKAVTGNDADLKVFKVPSLRNITKTGPYLHDGSVADLDQMIRIMAEYQLGKQLDDVQVSSIRTFLAALEGEVPKDYVAKPALPESGPDTPKPDPT